MFIVGTIKQSGFIHNLLHRVNKINIDKYATEYFAISKLAAKWLYKNTQIKNNNYKVIPNGIQVNNFLFSEEKRKQIRKELGIENKKVIGHIGKFLEQKNHKFLIDIFYELCKKEDDVVLLLLGKGPLENEIRQKVKKLNLEDKVIFLGVKQNANEYLSAMDVFLFPSLYEGFGRVLIEAQASDLPCIATAETIPEEVEILDTFQFVDLNSERENWIVAIKKAMKYTKRKNRKEEIQNAGYDIEEISKKLQEYYLDNAK